MQYRTYLLHYTKISLQMIYERISKVLFILKCKAWDIKLGKSCTFCGVPKIRKTPGSKIIIGNSCRILSKFDSNLHGLNRKSMFSTLNHNSQLIIGNDCGLSGIIIACAENIVIGDRVMIGANCTITDTDSHSLDYKQRHPDHYNQRADGWKENVISAPVQIEDDVFIGMNSIILKGVKIGKGSVIGAGSVVSKSIPEFVIAAGNPAKPIKSLEN